MDRSLHIGRLAGIEVKLHYSWFFIFALLAWSLAISYFPAQLPGLAGTDYWVMGIIASVLLFCSVLLHEMSHSLVALYNKIKVESITLFFFGGVAQVKEQDFTPKKEFWIAIAGPAFSISFALLFLLIVKLDCCSYVSIIAGYLLRLNLLLGFFNLVPGFPLDGGRVLRAILWKRFRSIEKATYYAAEGGKMFALFMIFFGIASIFFGGFGLWYILLGAFLYMISKMSYRQTVIKSVLEKIKIKDVMKKKFKSLSPTMPLSKFDFNYFVKYEQETFPVVKGKTLLGLVRQQHIGKAKMMKKKLVIGNITIPLDKISILKLNESCYTALEIMMKQDMDMLPVVEGKKLKGMLKANTLIELVKIKVNSLGRRLNKF